MYVKVPLGDLNPGPCPLLPISMYTCGMTITSGVHGGSNSNFIYEE